MFLELYHSLLFLVMCSSYISGGPPQQGDGEDSVEPLMNCQEFYTRCALIIISSDVMKCSDMDAVDECLRDIIYHCQRRRQPAPRPESNVSVALTSSPSQRAGPQAQQQKQQHRNQQKGRADPRDGAAVKNNATFEHDEDLAFLQESLTRLRDKTCLEDTNAGTKVTWLGKPSFLGHCCMVFCFISFHWLPIVLSTLSLYS